MSRDPASSNAIPMVLHWDGASAPGFDDVDEAVAWGIALRAPCNISSLWPLQFSMVSVTGVWSAGTGESWPGRSAGTRRGCRCCGSPGRRGVGSLCERTGRLGWSGTCGSSRPSVPALVPLADCRVVGSMNQRTIWWRSWTTLASLLFMSSVAAGRHLISWLWRHGIPSECGP